MNVPTDLPVLPSSAHPFNTSEVKSMLEQLVSRTIDRQKEYDAGQCTQLSKDLSRAIKDALKTLKYERYKFVIQVVVGHSDHDNLLMTCRCLWDVQRDQYASFVHATEKIFCAVTVFGLFYC